MKGDLQLTAAERQEKVDKKKRYTMNDFRIFSFRRRVTAARV
tara:strand:- start:1329 stop:1454 length:126 start_codon:yes stop_codon:yes gene_type:complete